MSILVNSTISDEGMSNVLEQASENFRIDRIGAPAKTSHATKRIKEESSNLYSRRKRVMTQHQGSSPFKQSSPQETPLEGMSVDSKFFGEKNAHLLKLMKKGKEKG